MIIELKVFLLIANVALAIVNHINGNNKVAMFSSVAVGLMASDLI